MQNLLKSNFLSLCSILTGVILFPYHHATAASESTPLPLASPDASPSCVGGDARTPCASVPKIENHGTMGPLRLFFTHK